MNFLKKEMVEDFCLVTLNRPDSKNAFNPEMIREITELFSAISSDLTVKAIVLQGAGTAFCAGADLAWMKSMAAYSYDQNLQDSGQLWDMFASIKNCEIPIIAKVHGAVFGGALGILACCDYVIAEESTKYCFSEVKLGLAPAVISSFILDKCADAFIRPLMISGEMFHSAEAEAIGLVQFRFHGAMPLEDIMQRFSANGANAMRATKKLLNQLSQTSDRVQRKKWATELISKLRVGEEAQKKLEAFFQKK